MSLKIRSLAIVAGSSYVVIFFAAIFANFFALEALKLDPLNTVLQHGGVRQSRYYGLSNHGGL